MKQVGKRLLGESRQALGFVLVFVACSAPAFAKLPPPAVPEIDPTSAISALTLLSSGVLLLTNRRRPS
jgi:hypothetical protein